MSYSSEVLADSPLLLANLDETSGATSLADSSGNSRPFGTVVGSPTFGGAAAANLPGTSMAVAGTQYAKAVSPTFLNSLTAITIEAWFKTTSSGTQYILTRDDVSGDTATHRSFHFYTAAGKVTFLLLNTAGGFGFAESSTTFNDGNWHHAVGVYSGGSISVYVDKVLRGTGSLTGTWRASAGSDLTMAAVWDNRNSVPSSRFTGSLDAVAVYGSALSSTRIGAHYDAGVAAPPTTVATPVSVGMGFAATTVLTTTVGLAASVALAFTASPVTITTVAAPVSVGMGFAASTVEGGTTTLAMPVSAGLGFNARPVLSTTVTAPVTAGLSFAATKTEPTTLTLPVTVGLGFAATSGISTTVSLPVSVELGFAAHGGDTIALPSTTQPTTLPFVTSGHATASPPLATPPPGVVERPIMRASKVVPDLRTISGVVVDPATNQLRLPDNIYHALPTTHGEVGVPHLIFHHEGKVVDATYFRGGFTKILTDRREEPFGDYSLSFELPNVSSLDSYPDDEDHPLWFLINRANVQIELVKSDGSRTIVWTGHVVATDTGNSETSPNKRLECVGSLFQASTDRMHPPPFLDPTDIGTLMSRVLTAVTSRRYPVISAVATGIMSRQRGSWADSPLAFVQSLLSTAWTAGGNQWTIAKVEGSRRSYEIRLKKTAPEWTVTNGAHGVAVDLTRDGSTIRNVIYGHGVGPDGNAWFNYKYPNLHADTAPAYPFASPASVITVGTTDASTTSGHGVSDWQRRARDLGYKLAIDGVFNASDAEVARYVQRRFGVSVDGVVGPQTWNATFGVGSNSGDLSSVIRLPLAADPRTQRYLYNGDGSIAGENPAFDGNVLIYADDVDFGAGITRADGIRSAQQIVDRESEPGLTGRITLTQDPRENSRLLIPPGDKITLVGYEGADRVLHITAVERDWQTGTVTLEVDEKSRDAMTNAQIRARDTEARRDPARRPGNPNRRSRLDVDQVVPFDGESGAGVIPRLALFGGLWSVIRIPVSETGRVAKMHLEAGAPFAIAFFGAPITPAHLVAYVGNPFTSDAPFEPHEKQLSENHWFIEAFGQKGQRCGYYPGSEAKGKPFKGVEEQGGFEYTSSRPPWIWVAMYAASSCFLEGNIYPDTVI